MTNKQQPKELSKELQAQIAQEAIDLTAEVSSRSDYYIEGIEHGYQDGATKYCILLQSEQEKRKEAEDMMEKMEVLLSNSAIKMEYLQAKCNSQRAEELIQSIHDLFTKYNNYKAKKDGTVNG